MHFWWGYFIIIERVSNTQHDNNMEGQTVDEQLAYTMPIYGPL